MRNKLLNFFLSIIVILIVVIFSIVYYYMYNNKAEISVYNELYTKEDATIRDEVIEEKDNLMLITPNEEIEPNGYLGRLL